MLGFLKPKKGKIMFDRKVLRKNDISLLILDERWNNLFSNLEKTPDIIEAEEKLKDLIKFEANLTAESKKIGPLKKKFMEKILSLTTEVYNNNNEDAKKEMAECEIGIKKLNKRVEEIEKELDILPDKIKEANLKLLEYTVNSVYFKIRKNQKRAKELDELIEGSRRKLKDFMEERAALSEDYTDVYGYFHKLLGGEELEKLDNEYFKS